MVVYTCGVNQLAPAEFSKFKEIVCTYTVVAQTLAHTGYVKHHSPARRSV